VVTAGGLPTDPGKGRGHMNADEDFNHSQSHRKKQLGSGIKRGKTGSFHVETAGRAPAEAGPGLRGQGFAQAHSVLAHGRVCQPCA
jgi:hypothetical protein